MTTKEHLHKLVDELSEAEADDALRYVASRQNGGVDTPDEPDTVGLPESWKTFDDGTPQPNWTASIRADRDHGH
jgi:hypothetical protein